MPDPDANILETFFEYIYGNIEDGYTVLSYPSPNRTRADGTPALDNNWYDLASTSIADLATQAATLAQQGTLYHGCVVQSPEAVPSPVTRGRQETAYAIPGFWADIDIAGGQHKATALPASLDEAIEFVQQLPHPPSLIVASGGGIYAWWLFREPLLITSDDERHAAGLLVRRFGHTIVAAGKASGWSLDMTGDLARLLRPAGSINAKYGNLVTIAVEIPQRYNPGDFDDWLLPVPAMSLSGGGAIAGQPDIMQVASHYGATGLRDLGNGEYQGTHPAHDSSTGTNFNLNISTGLWHCWRHLAGGDALSLIAVCEGWIACEDLKQSGLQGQLFQRTMGQADALFGTRLTAAPAFVKPWGTPLPPGLQQASPVQRSRRIQFKVPINLADAVEQFEALLLTYIDPPTIYQRNGLLTRVLEEASGHVAQEMVTTMFPLTVVSLGLEASNYIDWYKWDKREQDWKETLPYKPLLDAYVEKRQWGLPRLRGVSTLPLLLPDGSVCILSGYNAETQILAIFDQAVFPPAQSNPTIDDARTAIGTLQEAVQDFPFASPVAHSIAYAAIMQLCVRHLIQGPCPLFAIDSSTPGSGKSLLVDVITAIGSGSPAPRFAQLTDEEELRKRLFAIVNGGWPAIHIDNIDKPFGGALIDAAITSCVLPDRRMHTQSVERTVIDASWFCSGNNIVFKGDLGRRALMLELDPQVERPELRSNFLHPNLLPWVVANRPQLAMAAITIVQAFMAVGRPQQTPPLGSFEAWSLLIRDALIWAGEADPCAEIERRREEADERFDILESLLDAWKACYPLGKRLSLREIERDINARQTIMTNEWTHLREALVIFDEHYDGRTFHTIRIGKYLRSHLKRIVGGYKLMSRKTRTGTKEYWIQQP